MTQTDPRYPEGVKASDIDRIREPLGGCLTEEIEPDDHKCQSCGEVMVDTGFQGKDYHCLEGCEDVPVFKGIGLVFKLLPESKDNGASK